MTSRGLVRILTFALIASCMCVACRAEEFRGVWADAWPSHVGFHTADQTTAMINDLANGHFNAIAMNAHNAGYAYFHPTAPNTEPEANSSYDALGDVITKAHAKGIKVHAWICCYDVAPRRYSDKRHVMNLHPEWLMKNSSGATTGSGQPDLWMDPGVPDASTWLYNVCMDIAQHYDVDGIHFDFVRYPGPNSGYNEIALARFNDEYGRTGQPATDDADFCNWRRRQISDFVKKVYANVVAIKPKVVISAATFGSRTGAVSGKFQDWPTWMSKGYLDAGVPMIYYSASGNASFLRYVKDDHSHVSSGRHMYIGQGAGQNPVSDTATQIGLVRTEGCQGVMCYSYANISNAGIPTATAFSTLGSTVYATPANAPAMPWKTTEGIVKGTVTDKNGKIYNAEITIKADTDLTDATGFYALMKLAPGTYTVSCAASGYVTSSAKVSVVAGGVVTKDFVLKSDGKPPVMSGIQAAGITSAAATINWTTDEKSSGQVEYGTSTSYGTQTLLNTAKLTSHTFNLTGLTPSTTYHYRVKSVDGAGNAGVSQDQTFATVGP